MTHVIGITRVRNEAHIIRDVLDHVGGLVDDIIVIDDASDDDTPRICERHPDVMRVLRNKTWDPTPVGRAKAEGALRQLAYEEAVRQGAEWVYCFDADEFLELDEIRFKDRIVSKPKHLSDLIKVVPEASGFLFRLFDYYITPADVAGTWRDRTKIGPEFRDIMMLCRVAPGVTFANREPSGISGGVTIGGWVRHYGKAISVEHWERTCDYYVNHRGGDLLPSFTLKWEARRGKAVHETLSDFGRPLIEWSDRLVWGVPLEDDPRVYMPPKPAVDGAARVFKYGEA